jgi:hypothetical protein
MPELGSGLGPCCVLISWEYTHSILSPIEPTVLSFVLPDGKELTVCVHGNFGPVLFSIDEQVDCEFVLRRQTVGVESPPQIPKSSPSEFSLCQTMTKLPLSASDTEGFS